jgi:hypothetical protein
MRSRLTYANVMATAAFFLALGGVSIAASNYLLDKKNVIHSRHIAPGAVRGSDIAKGVISQRHLSRSLRTRLGDGPLPVPGTYLGTGKLKVVDSFTPTYDTVTIAIDWSGSKVTSFSIADHTSSNCDWSNQPSGQYQGGNRSWSYQATSQAGYPLSVGGRFGGTEALIVANALYASPNGMCQSFGPITTSVTSPP